GARPARALAALAGAGPGGHAPGLADRLEAAPGRADPAGPAGGAPAARAGPPPPPPRRRPDRRRPREPPVPRPRAGQRLDPVGRDERGVAAALRGPGARTRPRRGACGYSARSGSRRRG
ncbi:MAG TPA: hypothetical protein DEA08_30150, partial [Planctomycetes bacterium]|nr:hypothetical protein [Planctomycetota bacterium]